MSGQKCFQALETVNVPDKLRDCPVNGLRVLKHVTKDVLVVWIGGHILLADITRELTNKVYFQVLKVDNSVEDVFSMGGSLFCYDSRKMLYKLDKDEWKRRLSGSDMFHSSSDHESEEELHSSPFRGHTFKPSLELNDSLAVHPLQNGLAVVKRCFGKFFLAVYKENANGGVMEETSSIQICSDFLEVSACLLLTRPLKDFSPGLVSLLLKEAALSSKELVLVAPGRGLVYCLGVAQGHTLSSPKLLYRTADSITALVLLPELDAASPLIYLGVVLRSGPVMLVSLDGVKRTLLYEMTHLPGPPLSVCCAGHHLLAGDGLNLWGCRLKRDAEEGRLSLDHRPLGVKGVHRLSSVGNSLAIAATAHGGLYVVYPDRETDHIKVPRVSDFPLLLSSQLQELSRLRQELIREEELLAALNISLKAGLVSGTLHMTVRVEDSPGTPSQREVDLKNRCTFFIMVENSSDVEFPASIWMAHVSLSSGSGVFAEKTSKLEATFKKGVTCQIAIQASIVDLCDGVEVKCCLVCKLPEEAENTTYNTPWFIVPVATKCLDIAHFFRPHTRGGDPGRGITYKELLRVAQRRHRQFGQERATLQETDPECRYEVRLPEGTTPSEAWRAMFKDCQHRCSQEVIQLFEEDCPDDNSVLVDVGRTQVTLSLQNSCLTLRGRDLRVVHCVKSAVVSRLAPSLPVTLDNVVVSRPLEFRDTIEVKKSMPSLKSIKSLRAEWRAFISENIPL